MGLKKSVAGILCLVLLCLSFGMLAGAQDSAPLQFVVLGDSIAEGAGAIVKNNIYADRIARARGYELRNFGKGGDTSADLLRKVSSDETLRQAVREADIIAVSIGGNDFYPSLSLILNGLLGETAWMEPRRGALRENFAGAIAEIRALNPNAMLIVQTLYNPVFALMPPSAYEMYEDTIQGVNGVIREYLALHPGAYLIADVYGAFAERYGMVSIDMVHPSDCGHAVIAAVLMDTIDGTQTRQPSVFACALDVPVRLLRPLLALLDRALVGTLGFVRDALPSIWARIAKP